MENPYQPPMHEPLHVPSGRLRRVLLRIASALICALCVLQFMLVWTQIAVLLVEFGLALSVPMLLNALMPFTLMLAGVFLVFGRRLSAVFFALYLAQYLVEFGRQDGAGSVGNIFLAVAFLGYSLWLWKSGDLRGWPHARTRRQGPAQ